MNITITNSFTGEVKTYNCYRDYEVDSYSIYLGDTKERGFTIEVDKIRNVGTLYENSNVEFDEDGNRVETDYYPFDPATMIIDETAEYTGLEREEVC